MRLEAHLLNQIETNMREDALALYRLLPRKQQITKLIGVNRQWKQEDDVLEYIAELRKHELAQQIEAVRSGKGDEVNQFIILRKIRENSREELPALVVAFVSAHPRSLLTIEAADLLAGCGDEAVPHILPLLSDTRWSVRMRAVNMLAKLSGNGVSDALKTFLATEQDAEIRHTAENALKAKPG